MTLFNTRFTKAALATTAVLSLTTASADAALVQVDLNDAGTAPGSTWNVIATPTATGISLNDTTGTDSGIDLSIVNDGADLFKDSGTTGQAGAFTTTAPTFTAAAADYFWGDGDSTAQIVLSNVAAGTYTIQLVSSRSTNSQSPRLADITVNGAFADTTPNGDGYSSFADGFGNGSLLVWNSVTPDGSNEITIQIDLAANNNGHINAFSVELVPEPSSLALLGFGGLLIARRRRA